MKGSVTRFITRTAVIAALYAALTLALAPLSYGPIQLRVSEAMTVLPLFFAEAIPGLAIGCLIANIVSTPWDMLFGTIATLVAALCTRGLKKVWLGVWPPVIFNALLVPVIFLLSPGITTDPYWFNAVTVGAGEAVACAGLGIPVYFGLKAVLARLGGGAAPALFYHRGGESMTIADKVAALRDNFIAGGMRDVSYRRSLLKKLKAEIKRRETDVLEAMRLDFNKCAFDAYTTEIGLVYGEIGYFIKHLKKLARPKRVRTSLKNFPAKGRIYPEGYGAALIIAPWNYPFQLAMMPLVGAVAAGNTAVVKPASATKSTGKVIAEIVGAVFRENEVLPFIGSRDEANELLECRFDYIFFTGGTSAAKKIAAAAAVHLTPLSLELGGKSPCIIDESANIELSARRLAWGKFLNGGQTCVAPDYILVRDSVYEPFKEAFIRNIRGMYYEGDTLKGDFPLLVSESKGAEMAEKLAASNVVFGGKIDGRFMEPTVVECGFDSPLMTDEIFAPVAPLIRYHDNDEIIRVISSREQPLALYYFGKNPAPFIERCSYGGGCVNETVMHVAEEGLPFGGVGFSGMGRYHGKSSFDTFTHYKSVLFKGKLDVKLRYDKSEASLKTARKIMK